MHRLSISHHLLAVILVLLPGLLLLPNASAQHAPCKQCHTSHNPGKNNYDLSTALPDLCVNCHEDRAGAGEHPIGMVPSMEVPDELPLLDEVLDCTTCHDAHADTAGMLRLPREQLCTACH